MIYTWFRHDLCMIYTWFIPDLYLIYTWFIHYLYMIYTWFRHDLYMIYTWFRHDLYMIYLSKNMDFHSYVKLPEGSAGRWSLKNIVIAGLILTFTGSKPGTENRGSHAIPKSSWSMPIFPIQIVILGYTAYPIFIPNYGWIRWSPCPLARGVGQNDLEPTKKTQKNMVIQMIVMIV